MNYFFEGKISTFCIFIDGFKIFGCLAMKKIEIKVFACFFENTSLLFLKIFTKTLSKMLVVAFRKPPVIL
jgi:hypothetical protein